ncbi:LysR family transcriptional regulator [Aliagarivorans marinus]|uniref:LysR family transcriptional regulator n=1 Tax=Aliagarivorans marinus TaxID=561965 RepID=UPI000420DF85|nr:LysR family transcriptional regulator [Aliagarivorans marinus]
MNKLRAMSIFAEVVEAGSVTAAADKLELSKSVVSQHLKALELELGVTLMKRTTRRQTLTDTGERFYQSCKEINSIAGTAWDDAQQSLAEPKGRIRITAPNALMEVLITPVIVQLMHSYPKLRPELISDDKPLNLMQHDIDLAVRVGSSPDSNLKQQRLGEFRDVLCGATNLDTCNVNALPYIANDWQGRRIRHEFRSQAGELSVLDTQATCICNSFNNCLSLIKAGAGIGIVPDFYLQQKQPQLKNLMPHLQLPNNTVYALSPFNTTPLAVKLCIEAIAERLKPGG